MIRSIFLTPSEAMDSPYRVERPRASDAVGHALSNAYGRDAPLPEDMTAILHRLNDTAGAAH